MPVFEYQFTVDAPLRAVSDFHHDTRALKVLTPPPVFVQLHEVEPLAEGSVSRFTLWFGPFPVRWMAVHYDVSPRGFTDTQEEGLLKRWQHTHRFTPDGPDRTQIREYIIYEHYRGWRGAASRMLFSRPALWLMFTYRAWVTRSTLRRSQRSEK